MVLGVDWWRAGVLKNVSVFIYSQTIQVSQNFKLLDSCNKGTSLLRNVGNYLPVDEAYQPRVLKCCVHTHTHSLPPSQQMRYYCHTGSTSSNGLIQLGLSPLIATFRPKSAFTTKITFNTFYFFNNHIRLINVPGFSNVPFYLVLLRRPTVTQTKKRKIWKTEEYRVVAYLNVLCTLLDELWRTMKHA